jgi:prepilin peptidase CpaA
MMYINLLLLIVVTISLVTDLRERKIYNKVVFPGILCGLVLNSYYSGLDGLVFSLKGFALGIGLLLIPLVLGGMGAGDVKLLGAIGAIKGPAFVFTAFLGTALAGGAIAVLILMKQKRFLLSVRRILAGLYIMFTSKDVKALETLESTEYSNIFPYGVAIAVGTLVAYIA